MLSPVEQPMMKLSRIAGILLVPIALIGAAAARADVTFNGFGQIVGGSTLGNDHVVPGIEYHADPDFKPETLLALQVQTSLSDKIMATAQIVAAGGHGEDFAPSFEWAYVSYWLGEHWQIKGGRQRIPLYRYSDFLEVGASYPWMRPPQSVYQGVISNYDGLSASGYYEFGRWSLQPQIVLGEFDKTFDYAGITYQFDLKRNVGMVLSASYDGVLDLRASGIIGDGTVFATAETPLLEQILPNSVVGNPPQPADNSAVIDALAPSDHSMVFYGAGIDFHPGHWQLRSEFAGVRFNDTTGQRQYDYYVSGGYRFGHWTPVLTFGRLDSASSDPAILDRVVPGSQCPVAFDPASGQIVYQSCSSLVAQTINTQRQLIDYYEAGLRYDLTENTALKLDFTRRLARQGVDYGTPGDPPASNLLSIGFVFVF
jgi:hypothetical protein